MEYSLASNKNNEDILLMKYLYVSIKNKLCSIGYSCDYEMNTQNFKSLYNTLFYELKSVVNLLGISCENEGFYTRKKVIFSKLNSILSSFSEEDLCKFRKLNGRFKDSGKIEELYLLKICRVSELIIEIGNYEILNFDNILKLKNVDLLDEINKLSSQYDHYTEYIDNYSIYERALKKNKSISLSISKIKAKLIERAYLFNKKVMLESSCDCSYGLIIPKQSMDDKILLYKFYRKDAETYDLVIGEFVTGDIYGLDDLKKLGYNTKRDLDGKIIYI